MKNNVLDYIDFSKINTLLEGFNKSTGFVTAILDLEGNVLSKSGWRKICTDFHRINSETNKSCLTSDTQLANMSIQNKYNIYKCHNGLYDVSIPLKIGNEHVANIFTGQFFMETPNENFFYDQAERYGFELEEYIEALRNVPIVTEEKVKDIVEFLLSITNIIIDLTKDMIEQKNLKTLLEASLESFNDILIWAVDKHYRCIYFNNAFKVTIKNLYDKEIFIGDELFEIIDDPKNQERSKANHDLALSGLSNMQITEYGKESKGYFESFYSPIFDENKNIIGATGFSRDVTTRVIHENEIKHQRDVAEKYLTDLREAGNLFKNSVMKAPLPIMIHDEDGNVLNISLKATELTLYTETDIRTIYDWTEKAYGMKKDDAIGFIKKLYESPETQHNAEFVVTTKDGRKLVWEFNSGYIGNLPNGKAVAMSVGTDITEKRKSSEKLLYISYHDSLTTLYNRRYYEENLEELDVSENYPLTIVMSDINGLKLVNDAFGHSAGDNLLIAAAQVISNSCRETDLVARIGGDEFIIAMPNTSGVEAEKIINEINEKAKQITIDSIELSISFGFATKTHTETDIQETFRSAEDQMYRVKLLEIPSMRSSAIETIINTLYEKDKNSEVHSRAVSEISERLSIAFGMDSQEVSVVKTAGLLHDIGKIIIPSSIITKKGKLTSEEYNLIKGHPEIGFRILNSTHDMRSISNIVLSHHERWDGNGYPRRIKAEEIPLQSRIISIADAFDAMTSERTYREVFTNEEALDEICNNSGTQFDPNLVDIFKKHFHEIIHPSK